MEGVAGMSILVNSKRDERVLAWLIEQVGEAAVVSASQSLSGARRRYVSNVAKALGLSPPKQLAVASSEHASRHIAAIQQLLGIRA